LILKAITCIVPHMAKLESVSEKLLKREMTILTEQQARIAVLNEQIRHMPNCTLKNQCKRLLLHKQEAMRGHNRLILQIKKYAK